MISDSCHPPPSPSRPGRGIPKPSPLAGEGRERGNWNQDSESKVSAYAPTPPPTKTSEWLAATSKYVWGAHGHAPCRYQEAPTSLAVRCQHLSRQRSGSLPIILWLDTQVLRVQQGMLSAPSAVNFLKWLKEWTPDFVEPGQSEELLLGVLHRCGAIMPNKIRRVNPSLENLIWRSQTPG